MKSFLREVLAGAVFLAGLAVLLTGCVNESGRPVMKLIHTENFENGLENWVVEQQPGGSVYTKEGQLIIEDEGGCSVWFQPVIEAPVMITYIVMASSEARVSDINCFWMASDSRTEDFFGEGNVRTGAFGTYDGLETYYVGYGGNYNSTTRFRRYTGDGKRPLLPEHDLTDPRYMIEPDHPYRIQLVAAGGRAQYYRDGELVFDYIDREPLSRGRFGFRTVFSKLVISDFKVYRIKNAEAFMNPPE